MTETETQPATEGSAERTRATVAQLEALIMLCTQEGLTHVSVGGNYRLALENNIGFVYASEPMKLRDLVIYTAGRASAPPAQQAAAPTTDVPPPTPADPPA